jgi:hypothetical protein
MGDKWDEIAATIPLHAVPYDEQQTESDKRQLRFEGLLEACLGVEGLRKIPPPQPLVDSFLFQDSLSWFSGGWGQGKSFGAVDVGLCVATGTPGTDTTSNKAMCSTSSQKALAGSRCA